MQKLMEGDFDKGCNKKGVRKNKARDRLGYCRSISKPQVRECLKGARGPISLTIAEDRKNSATSDRSVSKL